MKSFLITALGGALLLSGCATNVYVAKDEKEAPKHQIDPKAAALAKLKSETNAAHVIAQALANDAAQAQAAAANAGASDVDKVKLVADRTAATKATADRFAAVTLDTHNAATAALKAMAPATSGGGGESGDKAIASKAGGDTDSDASASGENKDGSKDFWGNFGFGVGLSLTTHLGSDDRVKSASLDANGLVRIDEEEDAIARIVLESHFFGDCLDFLNLGSYTPWWLEWMSAFAKERKDCGVGPFVAVQSGDDEVIDAVGAGLMIGFKRTNDPKDTSSFNIGIGYIVDPNETVLGKGVNEGQALPGDEADSETVRTRKKAQHGILFLTSFAF